MKPRNLVDHRVFHTEQTHGSTNKAVAVVVQAPKRKRTGQAAADSGGPKQRAAPASDAALLKLAASAPTIPAGKTAQRDAVKQKLAVGPLAAPSVALTRLEIKPLKARGAAPRAAPPHLAILPAAVPCAEATPAAKRQRRASGSSSKKEPAAAKRAPASGRAAVNTKARDSNQP